MGETIKVKVVDHLSTTWANKGPKWKYNIGTSG